MKKVTEIVLWILLGIGAVVGAGLLIALIFGLSIAFFTALVLAISHWLVPIFWPGTVAANLSFWKSVGIGTCITLIYVTIKAIFKRD